MGMGNYADGADTVSIDFVKEICPEEMENFQAALDETDVSFDDFCSAEQIGDRFMLEESIEKKIDELWTSLKKKFDKETGLNLKVVYHCADDRGDELDGGSFAVGGVYQLTHAGEKYINRITKKTWTNFG